MSEYYAPGVLSKAIAAEFMRKVAAFARAARIGRRLCGYFSRFRRFALSKATVDDGVVARHIPDWRLENGGEERDDHAVERNACQYRRRNNPKERQEPLTVELHLKLTHLLHS